MTDLSDAALRPHITEADIPKVAPPSEQPGPTLSERLAAGKSTDQVLAETKGAPKRRGRPPGSKNKATLEREAREAGITGSARLALPSTRSATDPNKKPEEKPKFTAKQKADRGVYLGGKVSETVNENLMLILMSMGVPTELLYKEGKAPVKVASPYTDLAQMITISPMQANIVGRFLAEMEATDMGGRLSEAAGDGKGPLVIYGVLSAATAVQWGRSLMKAYTQLEPLLEAYKAAQREAAMSQQAYANSQPA